MTINERIELIIKELGLNNNSFAKKLNVSRTVTFNITGGRNTKPSYDLLEKILFAFDNINAEWLLRGNGEMFASKSDPQTDYTQTIELLKDQLKKSNAMNEKLLKIIENSLAKK